MFFVNKQEAKMNDDKRFVVYTISHGELSPDKSSRPVFVYSCNGKIHIKETWLFTYAFIDGEVKEDNIMSVGECICGPCDIENHLTHLEFFRKNRLHSFYNVFESTTLSTEESERERQVALLNGLLDKKLCPPKDNPQPRVVKRIGCNGTHHLEQFVILVRAVQKLLYNRRTQETTLSSPPDHEFIISARKSGKCDGTCKDKPVLDQIVG